MEENDEEPSPVVTPERGINALVNLLDDVLENLTIVHLYAYDGELGERLLNKGAEKVVCVSEESSEDRVETDGIVWLEMDPLDFFDRERVPGVGMIITSPPEGTDLNRDVLNQLPKAGNLEPNSLVLILEATWNKTLLDNFKEYELIEDMEYDGVRIAVTQMREPISE